MNGSKNNDIKIKEYFWKQISGPNTAIILNTNKTVSNEFLFQNIWNLLNFILLQIANATSLTIGLYEFQLTVTDENKNQASDRVWIKVVQGINWLIKRISLYNKLLIIVSFF